jgi:heme-degrading monooxygenase HmoA
MSKMAKTPKPPYYAVVFTSERTPGDNGYNEMSDEMERLASEQKGFLGIESAREQDGVGITVSYWDSLEAIKNWKENERHRLAQYRGKTEWYQSFSTRICKVERDTLFEKDPQVD